MWYVMTCQTHDLPWLAMMLSCLASWLTTICHDLPWCCHDAAMTCHGGAMTCHDVAMMLPWLAMTCHDLPWLVQRERLGPLHSGLYQALHAWPVYASATFICWFCHGVAIHAVHACHTCRTCAHHTCHTCHTCEPSGPPSAAMARGTEKHVSRHFVEQSFNECLVGIFDCFFFTSALIRAMSDLGFIELYAAGRKYEYPRYRGVCLKMN